MKLASTIQVEGESPPIVLLHSLALDRSMWRWFVDHLRSERTVIPMDLRGHGESPKATSFSIEDMADDVIETMFDLGHPRAIIVGLSMGGCVAQAVANRHPNHVTGLGLVDTTAWYGSGAPERWAARAAKADEEGMASLSQFQLDRWCSPRFLTAHPKVGDHLLEVFANNDLDSYVSACHAMGTFDGRKALAAIKCPTVVIVGEDDPATTPAHAATLRDGIRHSTMHVIAGARHLTPIERPKEVASLLSSLWADAATLPGDATEQLTNRRGR